MRIKNSKIHSNCGHAKPSNASFILNQLQQLLDAQQKCYGALLWIKGVAAKLHKIVHNGE